MSNPRLQLLLPTQGSLLGVTDDIHDGDPIESNHLLEIDESLAVPIRVVEGRRVVRSVRVGLEEGTPFGAGVGVRRDVEEDGIGRRFEYGIGLKGQSAGELRMRRWDAPDSQDACWEGNEREQSRVR